MNRDTLLYGLLIAGGLLVYLSWKKNKVESSSSKIASTSTSGTFVDDVPVSQEVVGNLQGTGGIKPIRAIKNKISQIVEPLIGTTQQVESSGRGEFV